MRRSLTGPDGTPMRVLVVEDNAAAAKVVETLLSKLGCVADVVNDGREAVAMVEGNRYDCILMCQLPLDDAYSAARQIREREAGTSRVHIVAVTASSDPDDREAALAAGMDDQIPKPVHVDELVAIMRRGTPEPSSYALVAPVELAVISDAELFAHVQRFLREMMEMEPADDVSDIVDEFLQHGKVRVVELDAAVANGDVQTVRLAAHALKGSLSYMGVGELTAMCRTIEKHGNAGDLSDTPALLEQVKSVIARIEVARRGAD